MFSPTNSPGLHNVPISMSLVGYLVVSCGALNIPSLVHLQKYFICRIPEDVINSSQFWRLITTKLVFLDPKDLIWGATLVYHFREFERRYGSHKFASHLFGTTCISFVLELVALLIRWFIDKDAGSGFLPSGPYGLLFPLFVRFYYEIPNTNQGSSRNQQPSSLGSESSSQQWTASFSALGSIFPPITTKSLTYFFGFQLAWSSANSLNAALTGILAGILHRQNFLGVQNWLVIPNWLANLSSKVCNAVSGGSSQVGIGGNNNGIEHGRWSRVELPANVDEGPWHRQVRRQGQGFAETLVYPDNYWLANQNGGNIFGGFLGSWRQHNLIDNEDEFNMEEFDRERGDGVEIEEIDVADEESRGSETDPRLTNDSEAELVATLVDMGFPKDKALRALKSTNYDLVESTNYLLRADSSSQPSASAMPSSGEEAQSAVLQ